MNLSEILFPVYKLKSDKPIVDNGIVFYARETYSEDEDGSIITNHKLEIVDDLSFSGESLALRRLQMEAEHIPLFKIKRAFFFLGDFIKVSKPSIWFIDSSGKLFTHTKTTRASLVCQKVTAVFPIGSGGAIIEVEYAQRFKVLFKPDPKLQWAGVLHSQKSQILYGLYEEQFDPTWRMI